MSSMTQQKFVKNKHIPYGRSCLFANMRMLASLISRSLKILWSSSRAWSIRSLSTQSTTNINPCGRVCKLGRTLSLPPTSWENDSLNFLFWTQKCNRSYGMKHRLQALPRHQVAHSCMLKLHLIQLWDQFFVLISADIMLLWL